MFGDGLPVSRQSRIQVVTMSTAVNYIDRYQLLTVTPCSRVKKMKTKKRTAVTLVVLLLQLVLISFCTLVMHVIWYSGFYCYCSSVCDGYITTVVSFSGLSMQFNL